MKMRQTLAIAMLAATCLSGTARAASFYAFGDSLVDDGNIPKLTGLDFPPSPYVGNRFSNGPVWAEYFPGLTGLNFSSANDYAVGGAFTGPITFDGKAYTNLDTLPTSLGEPGYDVTLPDFLGQVQEFTATGTRLSNSDVVGVWVGANNYFAAVDEIEAGDAGLSLLTDQVTQVAEQTQQGVNALMALGGRRFVVFTLPELGETPAFNSDGLGTFADTISADHDAALTAAMANEHAATGANIIVMNVAQVFNELLANPAAYGKTNTTDACIDVAACVDAPVAVQNQYVFWDSVHPTTGTHLLIAEYAASALNGLAGLAAPAQIAAFGAQAFATQLNQRLDALRAGASGFSVDLPQGGLAGQVGGGGKVSGWLSGSYDYGSRNTIGADNGFSYDVGTVTAGVDDRVAEDIALGAVIGYGTDHGSVVQDGHVSANAYQLGAYATFYRPNFYVTANFAYGFDNYSNTRPGVLGRITAKPAGNTLSAGGEAGYVLQAGRLTYGPIAGLNVTHASLGSYTETGDAALTQSVTEQNFVAFVGDVGTTVSTRLPVGNVVLEPHLTATADDLFSGNGGSFNSVFTDEPTVFLTTIYPKTAKYWGEISGGVSAALAPNIAVGVAFATTVAKSDGADHEFSGNLHVRF